MRKIFGVLLSVLCICCAAIGLTGCKKDKHIHAFDKQVIMDEYKATDATCTEAATYYYSCECGEKGAGTFEYGDPLGHSFTNYVSDNNATCTQDGTKTAKCDHKGCNATNTISDKGSKLESKMSFKTLSVNGDKVYGKVSNDTETFSFINEVEYSGLIKYFVSFDIYGNEKIDTKTIVLEVGDNKVYITELLDDEPKAVFEVTIRRRPTYTVSFNTNGGTAVSSQTIEEDSLIAAPETANRTGYTFQSWDFDFSTPIVENLVISAKWNVVTYNIEYELNDGENNPLNPTTYTIESEDIVLQTSSKTGYGFVGWYADEALTEKAEMIVTGSYGNKKFYAKWTPTVYTIEYGLNGGVNNSANPTSYTIESEDIVLQMPSNTGYNFDGWYADEALSEKVEKIAIGSYGNKKFYAKWTPTVYSITYELNGGENNSLNPTTYTIESELTLKSLTRENYEFVGWYKDKALTQKMDRIVVGSTGDRTFYAKWLIVVSYVPASPVDVYVSGEPTDGDYVLAIAEPHKIFVYRNGVYKTYPLPDYTVSKLAVFGDYVIFLSSSGIYYFSDETPVENGCVKAVDSLVKSANSFILNESLLIVNPSSEIRSYEVVTTETRLEFHQRISSSLGFTPTCLTYDNGNTYYFYEKTLRLFSTNTPVEIARNLKDPRYAVAGNGYVYFSSADGIYSVELATATTKQIIPASLANALSSLVSPQGLFLYGKSLYVCDSSKNMVIVINLASDTFKSFCITRK